MTRSSLVSFHREMNNWPWTMSVRGLCKKNIHLSQLASVCVQFFARPFLKRWCVYSLLAANPSCTRRVNKNRATAGE